MNFLKNLINIVYLKDIEVCELQNALISFTFGVWLLLPHNVWHYSIPLFLLGFTAICLGLVQFSAVVLNHVTLRRISSILAGLLWTIMTIDVMSHHSWAGMLLVFSASSIWSFWRLGGALPYYTAIRQMLVPTSQNQNDSSELAHWKTKYSKLAEEFERIKQQNTGLH